jgi:hypothetical protein
MVMTSALFRETEVPMTVNIKGFVRQWYYARRMRLNRLNARGRVLREGSSTASRARSPLALWLATLCGGRQRRSALYSHRAKSGDPAAHPRAIPLCAMIMGRLDWWCDGWHLRRRLRIGDWPSQVETVRNETAAAQRALPRSSWTGGYSRAGRVGHFQVDDTLRGEQYTVAAASVEPCIDHTNMDRSEKNIYPHWSAASSRASFGGVRPGDRGSHVLYPGIT